MPGEKKSPKAGAPAITGSLLAKLLIPYTTVFVSSFCIMVLELVAGRLIARHLGSSLYTWTSVIGVVLAGIAIGNYIGGLIADRYEARRALTLQFILASAASAAIVVLDGLVGDWPALWKLSWPNRVASHVTLVFFVPSCLLGTISPVIAKMALDVGRETGRTIGSVYAWGVVGSLFGTFMTGFYFIDWFGTITIIWSVAAVLAAGALYYGFQSARRSAGSGRAALATSAVWIVVLGILMAIATTSWGAEIGVKLHLREKPDPRVIYSDESQYSYIRIFRETPEGERPEVRAMHLDTLIHSRLEMDNLDNFQYDYEKIYAAITRRLSKSKQHVDSLTIGGGGYVYPRWMDVSWPGSRTDVAEIDPAVTRAAMEAFGLAENTDIRCVHQDGRVFIDALVRDIRNGKDVQKYDFIYCDAVNDYAVPYQLTTLEFMEMVEQALKPRGVYLMNMIDIYDSGLLLGALYNTMRKVFDEVYVFVEGHTVKENRTQRDTFILVGTNQRFDTTNLNDEFDQDWFIYQLTEEELEVIARRADGFVLTDDHAPVENLLTPVVKQNTLRRALEEYVTRARAADLRGYREAAVGILADALAYLNSIAEDLNDPAISYYLLGEAFFRMKNAPQAEEALAAALRYNPLFSDAQFHLGHALAAQGRLKEAAACYEKVLEQNPADTDARRALDFVRARLPQR